MRETADQLGAVTIDVEGRFLVIKNEATCRKCGDRVASVHPRVPTFCKCKAIYIFGGLTGLGRGWDVDVEDIIERGVMIRV